MPNKVTQILNSRKTEIRLALASWLKNPSRPFIHFKVPEESSGLVVPWGISYSNPKIKLFRGFSASGSCTASCLDYPFTHTPSNTPISHPYAKEIAYNVEDIEEVYDIITYHHDLHIVPTVYYIHEGLKRAKKAKIAEIADNVRFYLSDLSYENIGEFNKELEKFLPK